MASTSQQDIQNEKEGVDMAALNQLLHSVGRLKFSLMSLGNLCLQMPLFPEEESEGTLPDSFPSLESNKILEDAFQEFLSQRSNNKDSKDSSDLSPNSSSVDHLQFIQQRLQDELQTIRRNYQKSFSEKTMKSIEV